MPRHALDDPLFNGMMRFDVDEKFVREKKKKKCLWRLASWAQPTLHLKYAVTAGLTRSLLAKRLRVKPAMTVFFLTTLKFKSYLYV